MSVESGALDALWSSLQGKRLGWAYRAYHGFIETLSPEVREHLVQGDGDHEPYVVVFGKSQVGKTTLLLELMGVTPQAQKEVAEVLRGGREHGKSATATTMEYRRSPDAHWRLDSGGGARPLSNGPAMCAALGELRQAMSERRLKAEAPVVVWIPDHCFCDARGDGIGTRMLDLPGDNPADPVEREHVQRMAQRYVPHADLILLVGRADGLTFLDPQELALPGIEDWQFVPNRFRIVTTFSFTPQSIQRFARGIEEELQPKHFRTRLLEQIGTFGRELSPEARDTKRYFPLEFGDSWRRQADADQAFVRRLDPVLARLKSDLKADIQASASEAARFRNALDVHVVARRKREACRREGEAELAAMDARIGAAHSAADSAAKAGRTVGASSKALAGQIGRRAEIEGELEGAFAIDVTEKITRVEDLGTSTGDLMVHINDVKSWLRQRFLETRPCGDASAAVFGNVRADLVADIPKFQRVVDDGFGALLAHLNGYGRSEYYPSVFSSYSKDLASLRSAIRSVADEVAQLARVLWRGKVEQRLLDLTAAAARADAEQATLDTVALQQRAEAARLGARRARLQAEVDETIARLDRDAETGKRFEAMLQREYLAELHARCARIAGARSHIESLLALLSAKSLAEERQKIKPS
jgi:hypothetical protein